MVADWKAFLYSHNYCSCKFRNGDLFWHFSNSAWTFFQLWFQLTTYGIILHIHRKNQHSMPIGLEMLSSWIKNGKFYKKYIFSTLPLHFFNSDYECAFQKTLSPVCLFSEKISFQFQLVRILWIILVSNWIDIFPTLLGHFSTLVPIDNLLHYSAYTPKKSAFYANWFGNAKQLNKKWKIL